MLKVSGHCDMVEKGGLRQRGMKTTVVYDLYQVVGPVQHKFNIEDKVVV